MASRFVSPPTAPSTAAPARRGATAAPPGLSSANIGASLAVVVALCIIAFVVVEALTWEKIAPGVSVLGTQVGGMTRDEAAAKLRPNVEALLASPLQLRYEGRVWNTSARDLGMRADPKELAESAYQVGRGGNVAGRLLEQVFVLVQGKTLVAASTTDQAALNSSLRRIAGELERSPQNAKLTITKDNVVQSVPGVNGIVVDVPATSRRVTEALASGSSTVDVAVQEVQPPLPDDLVRPAREQLDRILGDGTRPPLVLTFGSDSWQLQQADVLNVLSVEGGLKAGQPARLVVDDQPLKALAAKMAKQINQNVQEARFDFNGGKLKVLRPSREGREIDQAATVALIKTKLLNGEHTAELPVSVVKPGVSSDDPASLGITELIDKGSTTFAGSLPEKKWNIKLAAEKLNGAVVPPGGTFSFNKEVGPTTLEAGFKWGFGITSSSDGGAKTVPSVAGGICQVATTMFQPVFWSGYPLEERYWHMYWIPAYTSRGVVGLDVTVDSDSGLDFRWTNPTDNYVLIQSSADDESVSFALYGKKPTWTVKVADASITNRIPPDPRPVAQEEPTLAWGRTLAVEAARDGFDVVVTRTVTPSDGSKPRDLKLRSTYQPSRNVTLIGTAGKPANASVDDAIAKVLGIPKPSEATADNRPVGDPNQQTDAAAATPAPAAGATPAAKPTTTAPAPTAATPAAKPQATAAAGPAPAAPAATSTRTP